MVRYELDICAFCDTPTWCRASRGDHRSKPMCRACDVEIFFREVLYKPIRYILMGWQSDLLREVYGAVDIETGARRYQSVYAEVAKKNGKSFLVGGLPLYHMVREGIEYPKAYGAAAAKDQAGLVFQAAAMLWRANPILKDRLKLVESTKRITCRDGRGFYCVIAADGDVQDGVEPTLAILDELHRWKTAKARTLYQVITSGDISVKEPLKWQITTAGDRYESEICWMAHERARQVLDGTIPGGKFFGRLWAADPAKVKADPLYWTTRAARVEANPSHEDNGGFLKDERILSKLEEVGEYSYKRLHLNIWHQNEERWMQLDRWSACGSGLGPLLDRKCIIGLDLSKNTDFTALAATYMADDGVLDVKVYFWIPEGQVARLEKKLKVPLRRWIAMGILETTPGDAIDKSTIEARIRMLADVGQVEEIAYDPRFAWDFIGDLAKDFTCVEVKQYGRVLDAPMQWLMGKVLSGEVRHESNEILDWHMECTTITTDKDGLMRPDKEHLGRDARRIDGVSALLTACVRQMLYQQSEVGCVVAGL